jgi:hypothetical protein
MTVSRRRPPLQVAITCTKMQKMPHAESPRTALLPSTDRAPLQISDHAHSSCLPMPRSSAEYQPLAKCLTHTCCHEARVLRISALHECQLPNVPLTRAATRLVFLSAVKIADHRLCRAQISESRFLSSSQSLWTHTWWWYQQLCTLEPCPAPARYSQNTERED